MCGGGGGERNRIFTEQNQFFRGNTTYWMNNCSRNSDFDDCVSLPSPTLQHEAFQSKASVR